MINSQKYDFYLNKKALDMPIRLNQYDREVPFTFNLYNPDGTEYVINQAQEIVKIEMAINSVAVIISTNITIESNSITFNMSRETTLNSGSGVFNVIVESKDSTQRIGTFSRDIIVDSNALDEDTVASELVVSAIEDLQDATTQATTVKTDLDNSIANGDLDNYVLKDGAKVLSTNDFTNDYKNQLDTLTNTVINLIYPVGIMQPFANTTNPNIKFPNTTWTICGEGMAFVGVGEGIDKNGASKLFVEGENEGEYSHKLNNSECGLHTTVSEMTGYGLSESVSFQDRVFVSGTVSTYHNNVQPSYGIYMWKRIS